MRECDQFRDLTIEPGPVGEARLQRHAARCSTCRDQLRAEHELRELFAGMARPGPSLQFNQALRQRLRAESQRQRRQRWRLAVMQAYWTAATVASALILMWIRWPSELPPVPVLCSLGAVLGMAALAPLFLLSILRFDPLGLILGTMGIFRR